MTADSAGTKEPVCASSTNGAATSNNRKWRLMNISFEVIRWVDGRGIVLAVPRPYA